MRDENRENPEWNRRFGTTLSADILLLWNVFRMPCWALLKIAYGAASRPGGLRDIVRSCEQLTDDNEPLPDSILVAQSEMHK